MILLFQRFSDSLAYRIQKDKSCVSSDRLESGETKGLSFFFAYLQNSVTKSSEKFQLEFLFGDDTMKKPNYKLCLGQRRLQIYEGKIKEVLNGG